jgi:hypothetical protein
MGWGGGVGGVIPPPPQHYTPSISQWFNFSRNTARLAKLDLRFSSWAMAPNHRLDKSARLFLLSSEMGPPPTLSPAGECVHPYMVPGWGHTRFRERGWGGSQYGRRDRPPRLFISFICFSIYVHNPNLRPSSPPIFFPADSWTQD